MDRDEFMDIVYSEFESDSDNNRANRIIYAADEYVESTQFGTKLAEVGTDCISRRQAIDAVTDELDIIDHVPKWVYDRLEKRLKQLPNVQHEPCEDAVSREEVLNCLEWQYPDKTPRTKIMELPPVTPEQHTGKWLWQTGKIRCNQCLSAIRRIDHDGLLNLCPNCGVKIMEGANNEGN